MAEKVMGIGQVLKEYGQGRKTWVDAWEKCQVRQLRSPGGRRQYYLVDVEKFLNDRSKQIDPDAFNEPTAAEIFDAAIAEPAGATNE